MFTSLFWNLCILLGIILLVGACLISGLLILCFAGLVIASTIKTFTDDDVDNDNCKVEEEK